MQNPNNIQLDDTEPMEVAMQATIDNQPIGVGRGKIHADGFDNDRDGAHYAEQLVSDVQKHIVRVSPEAPICCIDGRCARCCLDGSPAEAGPSVAGGALATAYAAAELINWFAADAPMERTERFHLIVDRLHAAGIVIGAHCDTDNAATNFEHGTGCGAIDRMTEIMRILHEEKTTVDSLTNSLLEDSDAATPYVSASVLGQRMENWDSRSLFDMVVNMRPSAVEMLEGDVTSSTHGHAEQAVVFNFVDGTTVDRDQLYADTQKQVFVVDVWALQRLARALAEGPDASIQERYILHAMIAYQVATYLTLCDGSQRPVFIKP